jgi:hypothetical protein
LTWYCSADKRELSMPDILQLLSRLPVIISFARVESISVESESN